jgi:hypothetical protein
MILLLAEERVGCSRIASPARQSTSFSSALRANANLSLVDCYSGPQSSSAVHCNRSPLTDRLPMLFLKSELNEITET